MTEKEILISVCGEDKDGNSKAVSSVKMSNLNARTGEEDIIDEMVLENPIVNIFRSVKFTMIDLTFQNKTDFEFINLVGRLQNFCNAENVSNDINVLQTLVLTVSPLEQLGEYYLAGLHGSWCIQPSKVGAENDTVRFIFENEYFDIYHIDIEKGEEDDGDISRTDESN